MDKNLFKILCVILKALETILIYIENNNINVTKVKNIRKQISNIDIEKLKKNYYKN